MSKRQIREAVSEELVSIGYKNDKVVVVNADLARSSKSNGFVTEFPERSFNVGIAEQNMVSFAAGLACEGFIPYVFTMAPFLTMRACEQVRTDVAYGNRNVKLIGVFAGLSGGIHGATHWGMEDCGIITSMPNIEVLEASDFNQMKRLLDYSLFHIGPVYIRYGFVPVENIHDENVEIKQGGSIIIREGNDGAILCSGITVHFALEAAEMIKKETGKNIRVVEMYSIKPVDKQAIISACDTGNVIVAQDHNIFGGLGTAVAKIVAEAGKSIHFKILGIGDKFVPMASPEYLYHFFGYDTEGIKKTMLEMLSK